MTKQQHQPQPQPQQPQSVPVQVQIPSDDVSDLLSDAVWPSCCPVRNEQYIISIICTNTRLSWSLHSNIHLHHQLYPTLLWQTKPIIKNQIQYNHKDPTFMQQQQKLEQQIQFQQQQQQQPIDRRRRLPQQQEQQQSEKDNDNCYSIRLYELLPVPVRNIFYGPKKEKKKQQQQQTSTTILPSPSTPKVIIQSTTKTTTTTTTPTIGTNTTIDLTTTSSSIVVKKENELEISNENEKEKIPIKQKEEQEEVQDKQQQPEEKEEEPLVTQQQQQHQQHQNEKETENIKLKSVSDVVVANNTNTKEEEKEKNITGNNSTVKPVQDVVNSTADVPMSPSSSRPRRSTTSSTMISTPPPAASSFTTKIAVNNPKLNVPDVNDEDAIEIVEKQNNKKETKNHDTDNDTVDEEEEDDRDEIFYTPERSVAYRSTFRVPVLSIYIISTNELHVTGLASLFRPYLCKLIHLSAQDFRIPAAVTCNHRKMNIPRYVKPPPPKKLLYDPTTTSTTSNSTTTPIIPQKTSFKLKTSMKKKPVGTLMLKSISTHYGGGGGGTSSTTKNDNNNDHTSGGEPAIVEKPRVIISPVYYPDDYRGLNIDRLCILFGAMYLYGIVMDHSQQQPLSRSSSTPGIPSSSFSSSSALMGHQPAPPPPFSSTSSLPQKSFFIIDAGPSTITYTATDRYGTLLGGGMGPSIYMKFRSIKVRSGSCYPYITKKRLIQYVQEKLQQQHQQQQNRTTTTLNSYNSNNNNSSMFCPINMEESIISSILKETVLCLSNAIREWMDYIQIRVESHRGSQYIQSTPPVLIITGGDSDLYSLLLLQKGHSNLCDCSYDSSDDIARYIQDAINEKQVRVNVSSNTALWHHGIQYMLLQQEQYKQVTKLPIDTVREVVLGQRVAMAEYKWKHNSGGTYSGTNGKLAFDEKIKQAIIMKGELPKSTMYYYGTVVQIFRKDYNISTHNNNNNNNNNGSDNHTNNTNNNYDNNPATNHHATTGTTTTTMDEKSKNTSILSYDLEDDYFSICWDESSLIDDVTPTQLYDYLILYTKAKEHEEEVDEVRKSKLETKWSEARQAAALLMSSSLSVRSLNDRRLAEYSSSSNNIRSSSSQQQLMDHRKNSRSVGSSSSMMMKGETPLKGSGSARRMSNASSKEPDKSRRNSLESVVSSRTTKRPRNTNTTTDTDLKQQSSSSNPTILYKDDDESATTNDEVTEPTVRSRRRGRKPTRRGSSKMVASSSSSESDASASSAETSTRTPPAKKKKSNDKGTPTVRPSPITQPSPGGRSSRQKLFLKRRIAKDFSGSIYFGFVKTYIPPTENEEGVDLWSIQYDDGDAEDFEEKELMNGFLLYRKHSAKDKVGQQLLLERK